MVIAVDLRGLNFVPKTGINTYTLHLLYCLTNISKTNNLSILGIGLKENRIIELSREFPFFKNIKHTSIYEYTNYPKWIPSQFINILEILRIWQQKSLDNQHRAKFDYIILPQPKVIFKNPKTPLITCFHDIYNLIDADYLHFKQSFWDNKYNYQLLINYSRYCFANSISTASDIKSNFANASSKLKLFYLALPQWSKLQKTETTDINHSSVLKKVPKKFILAISGIEPRKNWHTLILAHHVANQNSDYNSWLILAGTPIDKQYFSYLQKLIKTYNVQNIQWILKPVESEKEFLLSNCICLVYPSFYEGFGLPILEAFKHGKTVITSSLGSMPEIAKKSGILIDPNNLHELARAILVMTLDEKFRKELESHTHTQLAEFSWDQYEHELEKLLIHKST